MTALDLGPTDRSAVLVLDSDLERGLTLRFVLAEYGYDVVQAVDDDVAATLIERGLCAGAVVSLTSAQFPSSRVIECLLEKHIPVLVLVKSEAQSCQQTYTAAVVQPGNPSFLIMMALIRSVAELARRSN